MADNTPYPGNPALPKEVRDKILSTFRHSLNLFKTGKSGDCAVGCEFILKMDPRFTPARSLLAHARDPHAPLDLGLMESFVAQTPAPGEKLETEAPDRFLISAIEAYADRKFDEAIENSNRVLAIMPGNADAREILEKAKRKKDLLPHVENFRQRALFALESGQIEEARLNYERLRGLDPEHPDVETLGERLSRGSAPAATMAIPAAADDSEIRFDLKGPGPQEALPFTPSGFGAPTAYPPPAPAQPAGSADAFSGMDGLSLEGFGESPAESPPLSEWASVDEAPREEAPKTDFGSLWGPSSEPMPALTPQPVAAPASSSSEIERLLQEGDDLAGRDPQGAIEIWSRVFLTDLSNAAAAERIEKTRAKLLETNRRVTEALNAGRSLYEAGKAKEARERFLEVLAIDENEPAARSFLQRIEDDLAHPPSSHDLSQRSTPGDILSEDELATNLSAFPAPAPARARPAAAEKSKPPLKLILAAAGVVALAIALFLVFRPHPAPSGPAAGNAAKTDVLAEANRLIKSGNTEDARQILSQIPAGDPRYGRAQQILANLDRSAAAPTSGTIPIPSMTGVSTPAPGAEARRSEAEAALLQHRFIAALSAFNLCASSYANDAAFRQEMAQARERVNELSPAVKLYNDGDYEAALPILWRLYQADHQNQDARSYLVRGYYDHGLMNLQNNLFEKASKDFSDALGVEPEDALSKRQKAFSDRYLKRSPDLLAQIYIKYLRPRP